MFNSHPTTCNHTIVGLLRISEGLTLGFLVWHGHGDIRQGKAEKTQVLEQFASRWERIGCLIYHGLFVPRAFDRIAEKTDCRVSIGQQDVFHGMVLRLAAPVVFLFTWVLGARDGTFGAIVKKGDAVSWDGLSAPIRARSSSRVRAGAT